jgi:hypothetical protein
MAAICVLEATRAGAQTAAMISPRSEQDFPANRHDRVYEPYGLQLEAPQWRTPETFAEGEASY